jgi:hypothetical protein
MIGFAVVSAGIGLVVACGSDSESRWKIDLGVSNVGTNVMDAARVYWGDRVFRGGIVSPSYDKTHVAFDRPIPENATVTYLLPDGREVSRVVAVRRVIPQAAYKKKDITVMFEVNSNTDEVNVKVLHFVEKDGYQQLVPFGAE